jgi:hypothetical protein
LGKGRGPIAPGGHPAGRGGIPASAVGLPLGLVAGTAAAVIASAGGGRTRELGGGDPIRQLMEARAAGKKLTPRQQRAADFWMREGKQYSGANMPDTMRRRLLEILTVPQKVDIAGSAEVTVNVKHPDGTTEKRTKRVPLEQQPRFKDGTRPSARGGQNTRRSGR